MRGGRSAAQRSEAWLFPLGGRGEKKRGEKKRGEKKRGEKERGEKNKQT